MVMVVHKQQNSIIIIIPINLCYYNFALKSLPGGAPDQALLLFEWLDTSQMVMVIWKHPKINELIILNKSY